MRIPHRTTTAGIAMVLALVAAGCGGSTTDGAEQQSPEAAAQQSTSEGSQPETSPESSAGDQRGTETSGDATSLSQAVAGFPREIEHALGTTTIPQQPKRVAALTAAVLDDAVALGVSVVAITHIDVDSVIPDYLGEAGQRLAGSATDVGAVLEPSLEKIAAAKPDLIITQASRHAEIYDQLSKIAPTVMSDETGSGWKETLTFVAEATGTDAKAENLLADYMKRADAIKQGLAAQFGAAPTAAPIRFTGGATIRLYLPNSFTGVVLGDCGFVLSDLEATDSAGSRVDVSQENIGMLDADYIFVASKGDDESGHQREAFEANPLWSRLKGEMITVRDDTWTTSVSYPAAMSMLDDLDQQFDIAA